MASVLVRKIHAELKRHVDVPYKKAQQWYFKEGIVLYGVRYGVVRNIASRYFRLIKPRDRKTVFRLCEELLASHLQETSVIAYQWAWRLRHELAPSDFAIFERWLQRYVRNWSQCDDLSTGPIGELLSMYPELMKKTRPWRRSRNRWVRRAAAVSLILPVRGKKGLSEVFSTADTLLRDPDNLVQKGYGWMLKEASNVYPKEVFAYVKRRGGNMPRVAFRYAIEKLPLRWRRDLMSIPPRNVP